MMKLNYIFDGLRYNLYPSIQKVTCHTLRGYETAADP